MDTPTEPEVFNIGTDDESDAQPQAYTEQSEEVQAVSVNPKVHIQPASSCKAKTSLRTQAGKTKKGNDNQSHPKLDARKKNSQSSNKGNKVPRTLQEESIQVALGASRYIVLSLFDGCGISRAVIAEALGQQPVAALTAESDNLLRAIICHKFDYDKAQKWALDARQVPSIAVDDVWSIVQEDGLILKQCIAFLGKIEPGRTAVIIPAGSPCQDLTTAGSSSGGLGLMGDRSQHMLVIYAILLVLQTIDPLLLECVHVVLENAGSMKAVHKDFIMKIFGIPEKCCHMIAGSELGHVERKRNFFTRYQIIGNVALLPNVHGTSGNESIIRLLQTRDSGEPAEMWLRADWRIGGAQLGDSMRCRRRPFRFDIRPCAALKTPRSNSRVGTSARGIHFGRATPPLHSATLNVSFAYDQIPHLKYLCDGR